MNSNQQAGMIIKFVIPILLVIAIGSCSTEVVPAGHVKVGRLFGKVASQPLGEGFHVVNPLMNYTLFDGRQKTLKITAKVPSRDQLTTKFDLSIQFRLNKALAPIVLKETGNLENAIEVHLNPRIRSFVREAGKGVEKAEDFFKDEIQRNLQATLSSKLKTELESKGIVIEAVLIRDVNLPPFIVRAIESKKEREQQAEKEIAELKRFKTEQEKKLAAAEADLAAAKKEAETKKVLADAQAYSNKKLANSLSRNLIENNAIEKWDGVLPSVSGGGTPFISLKGMK